MPNPAVFAATPGTLAGLGNAVTALGSAAAGQPLPRLEAPARHRAPLCSHNDCSRQRKA